LNRGFHGWIFIRVICAIRGSLLPPIGGEAAGAGGGEDGLAKAFEQDGNLRQPLLAGVHFAQQGLQLRHYPPLLS
jgi:hypothetical protein